MRNDKGGTEAADSKQTLERQCSSGSLVKPRSSGLEEQCF